MTGDRGGHSNKVYRCKFCRRDFSKRDNRSTTYCTRECNFAHKRLRKATRLACEEFERILQQIDAGTYCGDETAWDNACRRMAQEKPPKTKGWAEKISSMVKCNMHRQAMREDVVTRQQEKPKRSKDSVQWMNQGGWKRAHELPEATRWAVCLGRLTRKSKEKAEECQVRAAWKRKCAGWVTNSYKRLRRKAIQKRSRQQP